MNTVHENTSVEQDVYTIPLPMDYPDTIKDLGGPEATLEKCIKGDVPIYVFTKNVMKNTEGLVNNIISQGMIEYYQNPTNEVLESIKQRVIDIYPIELSRQMDFDF